MLLLPLKSQFASLIFTVLTFFAELCLVYFVRAALARHQNHRLQRGHRLHVRSHLHLLSLLLAFATVVFIAMELANSFVSDPGTLTKPQTQRCVAIDSFLAASDPRQADPAADVALLRCLEIDDDTLRFSVRAANYSLSSRIVQCSGDPLLEFPAHNSGHQIVNDAREPTMDDPFPDPMLLCSEEQFCLVLRTVASPKNVSSSNGFTTVRIYELITPGNLKMILDGELALPFMDTTLMFTSDARPLFEQLAHRQLEIFRNYINDPIEMRRRLFLGSRSSECIFDVPVDATQMPLAFALAAGGAWSVSVILGLVGYWLRSRVKYDVADPMHWATKTVRRDGNDAQEGGDPFVEGAWENGHCVVYVCCSQVQKHSVLHRIKHLMSVGSVGRSVDGVPRRAVLSTKGQQTSCAV
eukprot:TRINITY_DN71071_c0_g1_i1.p1 TRINITY_DN71071_c0_g1~~TRINITY_DN71071_c0_g1_i1.p1  ORF type:complete len:411 (+),score=59.60 TRINITY_DN71071_c0_g1_i1:99-1331(+)